ncbi:MAG: hypothetical protein QF917_00190 [Candidatus Woesearchaeota archaeon]|mgnify:CR=1 FL=1|jgi:hypothetical protein|nr:hypothetical protein [Candidatus Woesearchaeota archaeon]|tara:strand:+ start:1064 stop:1825 length:762 start_codon:yes stop_codon:yes gene_type:complete
MEENNFGSNLGENTPFNESFNRDKIPSKKPIIIISILLIIIIGLVWIGLGIFKGKSPDTVDEVQDNNIHEEGLPDPSLAIEDDGETDRIIDECITKNSDNYFLALLGDDVELCRKSDDFIDCSDNYYIMNAVKENDNQLCEQTSIPEIVAGCKGILTNDVSACESFESERDKNYCKALVNRDISFCDSIQDMSESSDCKEDASLVGVLTSKNPEECPNQDELFSAFCKGLLAGNAQIYRDILRNLCTSPNPPS